MERFFDYLLTFLLVVFVLSILAGFFWLILLLPLWGVIGVLAVCSGVITYFVCREDGLDDKVEKIIDPIDREL